MPLAWGSQTKCKGSVGKSLAKKSLLRGISVAMYIVGQERRLVDPPSQVVAGVRTVTTKMDERCDAHVAALIRFLNLLKLRPDYQKRGKRWPLTAFPSARDLTQSWFSA
jgi:hypothetical protein